MMPRSWREWMRALVCAIVYIALTAPRWSSEAQQQTEDAVVHFLRHVLADTEDVWHEIFRKSGKRYAEPTLVLFTRVAHTACGLGKDVAGPFYCPRDRKIYLDLGFFDELKQEYHAPGDFARAYVVAHEVGHHVQKLLGVEDQVSAMQATSNERDANRLSVGLELQADCLAGVWASSERQRPGVKLTAEDIEEALRATRALGDDLIQKLETGTIVLDSFTHGSGDQRSYWFKRGLDTGETTECDTFARGQP